MRWVQQFKRRVVIEHSIIAVMESQTKDVLFIHRLANPDTAYVPKKQHVISSINMRNYGDDLNWVIADYPHTHAAVIVIRQPEGALNLQLSVHGRLSDIIRTNDFDLLNDIYMNWPNKYAMVASI